MSSNFYRISPQVISKLQKISYYVLSYPFISFHILRYPRISSGPSSQMDQRAHHHTVSFVRGQLSRRSLDAGIAEKRTKQAVYSYHAATLKKLNRSQEAKGRDWRKELAECLAKVVSRVPGHSDVWKALVARMRIRY